MLTDREGSTEQTILDLIAEAGARPSSLDDSLAELGLDSLACAELAVAVEGRFGVRLSALPNGAVATVREVADAVRAGGPWTDVDVSTLGRSQEAARRVVTPLVRWYARVEVQGADNVPRSGPVLIAPNHRSMFDIPVLLAATPRPLAFMAKRELFRVPLRRAWREFGAFPVRREIFDLRALDTALALLERGRAVAIYPEGTRNRQRRLLPFLGGAAWLAQRVGAPIVPCGVTGTGAGAPLWRRRRVLVRFGEPIRARRVLAAERRRERERITDELLAAVTALLLNPPDG